MEDQERKTLLDKESTNESVKPSPGVSFNLIGLTVISAILTVTYFASGIVHKSYIAISELNAQAPEPSSTVSYNGKIYASLGGGNVNGWQYKCQNDRYLALPNGWEIAADDADSRAVTAAYPWDTHVNVMSNGCGYGTASYSRGAQWNCGMLGQSGNAYKTNSCSLMILIRKVDNPQASEPSSTVSYNGRIYASLGGGNVNGWQYKCQNDRFLIPPNGWEVAPDNADSIAVTAAYPWDTHVNVLASGCGYGSASYTRGARWNCGMLGSNGAGGYKVNSCSLMVLIMKSNPPIRYAPQPTSKVVHKNYEYASLGGADVNSNTMTCQGDRYLALPDGWEIAPDEQDSKAVTANYPWGTHVNVMSNGCGYGTAAYTRGALWNCNMLGKSGIEYKVNACHLQILIRKLAPTSNPTPFPIALPTNHPIPNPTEKPTTNPTHEPTKEPISRPTFHPTLEPTHLPTEKPSFRPTHEPTLEPTKNPTFQPSAHPSKEPTPEPSSIPVDHPTHEPIPNPTMSPTHEPTHKPTLKPSDHPTFHPTLEPTHVPTEKPSFAPTFKPTLEPTKNPTFEPSAQPSQEPTTEPTKKPTHEPSLHPTERPSLEPTLFPTYKSTNYPTSKPTTPFPTFHPTLEPVEKNNMCTFEFVKGKSSLEVSSGCALISVDNIDYMIDGESTHAAYVCATSKKPTKLNDVTNEELGIKKHMSSIIPGAGCEVTMFSEDNSQGMRKTYTSKFHPTLVNFHFLESKIGNDGIVSMLVESVYDSFELPAECHQGQEVA